MSPEVATENLAAYNDSLRTSLADKLWFVAGSQADLWVDFGCADGSVLRALKDSHGVRHVLGYDADPRQVARANAQGVRATTSWGIVHDAVEEALRRHLRAGIHFSSVLDEVPDLGALKKQVLEMEPDVIVIRQHATDPFVEFQPCPRMWRDIFELMGTPEELAAFKERYGDFPNRKAGIQFILKSPYLGTGDYLRELSSDYLTMDTTDYRELFRGEYKLTYSRHDKGNGFIHREAYRKFGLVVPDRTHIKLILERR